MKTYENVKNDVNVRIQIKKPRLSHVWLFWRRLDNVQIKQTSNHIRYAGILRQNTLLEWQDAQW